MKRALFFAASVPVAVLSAIILTGDAGLARFWAVELPLAVVGFGAWCWLYCEVCV